MNHGLMATVGALELNYPRPIQKRRTMCRKMYLELQRCSSRFSQLACRAGNFAANPAAYMFVPRAMHVLPPVVTNHARIARVIDTFYKEYIHLFELNKGIVMVLENARETSWSDREARKAYSEAVAMWGKVRDELTQALYKEVFGEKR